MMSYANFEPHTRLWKMWMRFSVTMHFILKYTHTHTCAAVNLPPNATELVSDAMIIVIHMILSRRQKASSYLVVHRFQEEISFTEATVEKLLRIMTSG